MSKMIEEVEEKEEKDSDMKERVLGILQDLKIEVTQGVEIFEGFLAGFKFNINTKDSVALKTFKANGLKLENKLAELNINLKEAANSIITFADPTFDSTFKMLFGVDKPDNKEILISLLNSLLNFQDEDQKIVDLSISTNDLPRDIFSYDKKEGSLDGAVDILCTTTNGKKIAVEMQRAKEHYSLARTQEYMSKMISMQMKSKDSNKYDTELLDTYILTIAKDNLFVGKNDSLVKKHVHTGINIENNLYEVDVEPVIKQTGQVFPGNKMHWKFFELSKFKEHNNSKNLTKNSELKYQWLEFFNECSKQLEEPDRNELIKKGYEIMKMSLWNDDQHILYWKQQKNERDAIEHQKAENLKAFEDGLFKGELKGKLKGEVKGEIGKIKMGIDAKWEDEKILKKLKYTKDKFADIKSYFNTNPDEINNSDNESQICNDLKLTGGMNIEYDGDFS